MRGGKVQDTVYDYDSVPVPQGLIAEPGGNGDACRRPEHLAGEVAGVTQLLAQQIFEFAEGQPGLRDLDLDVRAPVVLEGVGGSLRCGRGLHRLQPVQESRRHHLASQPVRGHRRWRREGLDDQAAIFVRLPDEVRESRDDHQADEDRQ